MPPVWSKGLKAKDDPRIARFAEASHNANRGKPTWNKGKKGLQPWHNTKGLKKTERGKANINWKGGITPINQQIRQSFEYEEWRKKCLERDLYTCQNCEQIGGKLHVDHIKPFALFPELRFEVSNGRTLCEECHWTIGAKVKHFSTRADFEEEADIIGMLVGE